MSVWRYALLAMISVVNSFGQVDEQPPMPEWNADDMLRWEKGEDLISDMLFQSLQEAAPVAPMIEGFSWQDYEREVAEDKKNRAISADLLEQYFAQKPSSFLIDPQNILTRQEYRDRLSFLKYHDSDSRVGFYVYLFEGHQDLPVGLEVAELLKKHFPDAGPTAWVMYYMDQPNRTELYLSDELIRSVGVGEKKRALQSAINQALGKSQAVDQLDLFCVQMSIRLYWMEQAWHAGVIAPPEQQQDATPVVRTDWKKEALAWWQKWRGFGIITSMLLGCTLVCRWWLQHRARYVFANHQDRQRLGFPYAASTTAVVSFSHQRAPSRSEQDR